MSILEFELSIIYDFIKGVLCAFKFKHLVFSSKNDIKIHLFVKHPLSC